MTRRTLRRAISCIHELTGRRWTQIKCRDVYKSRISACYSSRPRRRNEGRTCRHPIAAAGADATIHPSHARLQHDLVYRRTTNAEVHVVVHLKTLDAVEDLHHRTCLSLAQDECVVDEAITTICISGTVTTNAGHARALRRNVLKHISHDIRIFTRCIVTDVLVAVRIGSNQFDLSIKTTGDPVVIDLVTFRTT